MEEVVPMKQKNKVALTKEDLKTIRKLSNKAFEEIGSENYKQKLVYNLLNIVRSGDQEKFLWNILRVLNSKKEDENVKKLTNKINSIYTSKISHQNFEKVAYTIIMGIMSSEPKSGGD